MKAIICPACGHKAYVASDTSMVYFWTCCNCGAVVDYTEARWCQ
jgi:transcription elongation factor Elf1